MRHRLRAVFLCFLLVGTPPTTVALLTSCTALQPVAQAKPVLNDPFSNNITFRLTDVETGLPVASTPCQMAWIHFDAEGPRYWCSSYQQWPQHFGWESSPEGLVVGTYRDFLRKPLRTTRQIDQTEEDRPDVGYGGTLVDTHVPVPRGYEPAWDYRDVQRQLLSFARLESRKLIELPVRKIGNIHGSVVDASGNPVPFAETFTIPAGCDGNEAWLRGISYFYEGEKPYYEDTPEAAARSHAEIIERVFEDDRIVAAACDQDVRVISRWPDEKPNEFRYTAVSNFRDRWFGDGDTAGRFKLEELPRGKWLIGAYHREYGFATQLVEIRGGTQKVVVTLPDDRTARIKLSIEWAGQLPPADDDQTRRIGIALAPSDPYGHPRFLIARLNLAVTGNGPWNLELLAVRPGRWNLAVFPLAMADFSPPIQCALTINPGEKRAVGVTTGPGAYGQVDLRVLVASRAIACDVQVESTSAGSPFRVVHKADSASEDEVRLLTLPSGHYQARIGLQAPIPFVVQADSVQLVEVNATLQEVTFKLDRELQSALDSSDSVWLELSVSGADLVSSPGFVPPGLSESAMASLQIAGANKSEQAAIVDISSETALKLNLPAGPYFWRLGGHKGYIGGRLVVADNNKFAFSTSAVPGMNGCVLDCTGLVWPELDDYFWLPDDENIKTPAWSVVGLDTSAPASAVTVQSVADYKNKRLLVFSNRASLKLRFEFAVNDMNEEWTTTLTFPGHGRLLRSDFKPPQRTLVSLATTSPGVPIALSAFDEGGLRFDRSLNNDQTPMLPPGNYTLLLYRPSRGINWSGYDGHWDFARLTVTVAESTISIDMDKVLFQRCGSIKVVMAGQCPGATWIDPWWQFTNPGVAKFEVAALDFGPANIAHSYVGTVEFRNVALPKPELSDFGQHVPPGRYKVIPWSGAPDSACKIVTVEPGKECVVRFEGR